MNELEAMKVARAIHRRWPADRIVVFAFDQAPRALRALSNHGGDEDWLAIVPPRFRGQYIGWLQEGSSFGCCSVSEHELPSGHVVHIGAHA